MYIIRKIKIMQKDIRFYFKYEEYKSITFFAE